MPNIGEEVRRLIRQSGISPNAVCEATGAAQPIMSRLLADKAWLMEPRDRIGELFKLQIVKGKAKGRWSDGVSAFQSVVHR